MNTNCLQPTVFLLSLAAIAGMSTGLPAVAQPVDSATNAKVQPSVQQPELEPLNASAAILTEPDSSAASNTPNKQPIPGTAETSASALSGRAAPTQTPSASTPTPIERRRRVAQAELEPGRATRSGSSYVGVGGNLGLTGDTAIGDTGFAIFSKIGLTRVLSVRPTVIIGDDTDFFIPVTYDFPIQAEPFERINFAPYVGAGVVITTDGDSNVGVALTGGVDVPISTQFTATASVTAAFVDTTDLGIMLGIGYNFGSGFRFR